MRIIEELAATLPDEERTEVLAALDAGDWELLSPEQGAALRPS